ncbi:MAG: NUDIX domain-containing protein, partial [Candidatus Yonathbacteria bacterium]|nr:NUDIX domain-containing protein [Candidatus Yonathbacteria bacterium]
MYERSYGIVPVHEEHGKFLFLLVREKAGHWGLPKGHPSKGESEIETARREFT